MIFHVYWMGIVGAQRAITFGGPIIDREAELAEFIKTSEDNSFVFVTTITGNYHKRFMEWVEKYGLKDLITFQGEPVVNPIHPNNGPNLVVTVITCKEHFWREMMPENIEEGVVAI